MKLVQITDDLIVNLDHIVTLRPMLAGKATLLRLSIKEDMTVNLPPLEVMRIVNSSGDDWIDPPVKEKSHGKR